MFWADLGPGAPICPSRIIDIGIYYDRQNLDIAALERAAQTVDDQGRKNIIARPGQWGKWVNGGGWLKVDNHPVDFLLRDIAQVEKAIAQCRRGQVTAHYQTGHPHGYINAMYMGEVALCNILWDRNGRLKAFKSLTRPYPPQLKRAMIERFMFEAGFSLMLGEKSLDTEDVYYVTAHFARTVSALNQVLFALNETYCLNEKRAVKAIEGFSICPEGYKNRVEAVFGQNQHQGTKMLKLLIKDVEALRAGRA